MRREGGRSELRSTPRNILGDTDACGYLMVWRFRGGWGFSGILWRPL